MTVFLVGGPAMTPREFKNYRRKTIVAPVLSVSIPTGDYDSEQLINLGSNRWHVTLAVAMSHWIGNFSVEAYVAVWIFSDNTSFLGDNVLSQDPVGAIQAHLTYTFKPRFWLALGSRRTFRGQTSINGVEGDDPADNSRLGLVFGFPVAGRVSAKFIGTTGIKYSTGHDFNTLNLQIFYAW